MNPDPRQLAAIQLFSGLSAGELEMVARWCEIRSVDPGTRLLGEGAAGYSFFVLEDGAARVTRDGKEIATLSPGDFFGEMAILGDGRRTASVEVTAPSTVLVMFGTEFRQLEQEMPEAAARIRKTMAARLADGSG